MANTKASTPDQNDILSEEIQRIQILEGEIELLVQKLEASEKIQKETEEKYLRSAADLQNVRRRAEEDRIKARLDGGVDVLKGILQLVDHFSLAFSHLPGDLKDHEWIKGIIAIEKSFYDQLTTSGVEFIDEEGGDFDESLHESMLLDPAAPKGKVSQVLERGVKYKGRVIRVAKVSVGAQE